MKYTSDENIDKTQCKEVYSLSSDDFGVAEIVD
jgi:hypothetical protein